MFKEIKDFFDVHRSAWVWMLCWSRFLLKRKQSSLGLAEDHENSIIFEVEKTLMKAYASSAQ